MTLTSERQPEVRPGFFRPTLRLLDFMRQIGDPHMINLAAGVPDPALLPTDALTQAYHQALKSSSGGCYAYQAPEGDHALRELLAHRLASRGVQLPGGADDVLLTTGCTQALRLALRLIIQPGDCVAVESPCYYNLLEQIYDLGARVLPVPTDTQCGILPSALDPLLKQHRPKCLVVCSSLSNPSGATIPLAQRPILVDQCRRYGVHIIEDDIYAELRDDGALPPLRSWDDGSGVTMVSSYCKSVAPGLRVGYMLPGKRWEEAANHRCLETMHGSTLAEKILHAFFVMGAFESHLKSLTATCRERRHFLRQEVLKHFPPGTTCTNPEGGFLLWVELPSPDPRWLGAANVLPLGVQVADGAAFLTQAPATPRMRLNAARASMEDLQRGARLLGDFFRSHA
ncbi:MAG: PLP-dependent aminotransferase family protein [Candidatus Methylacidiphilales bacterium]